MARGRRPDGLAHVERLGLPELTTERLKAILATLAGELGPAEAAEQLGISVSRLHALRAAVLEGAAAALAPAPRGRPPRASAPDAERVAALEARVRELEEELELARVRTEIAVLMPELLRSEKKETLARRVRR